VLILNWRDSIAYSIVIATLKASFGILHSRQSLTLQSIADVWIYVQSFIFLNSGEDQLACWSKWSNSPHFLSCICYQGQARSSRCWSLCLMNYYDISRISWRCRQLKQLVDSVGTDAFLNQASLFQACTKKGRMWRYLIFVSFRTFQGICRQKSTEYQNQAQTIFSSPSLKCHLHHSYCLLCKRSPSVVEGRSPHIS